MQQLVWQLGRQLGTGLVPGQRKSRSIQSFLILLTIESRKNLSPCKNSLGRIIGVPKTALAGERPIFPQLYMEAEEYKR
jgi:hypothetical protein